jgi:Tetracyclin repressor-like, C-terminal domain
MRRYRVPSKPWAAFCRCQSWADCITNMSGFSFRQGHLAHIDEALDEDDAATRKAAFLVTALVHAPDMMEPARLYYRALLDQLLSKSGAAHDVRHALLAVEGNFLLRGLGFVEVSAAEHKSVLLHARKIVAGVLAGRRAPRRRTSGLGRKPPLRGA